LKVLSIAAGVQSIFTEDGRLIVRVEDMEDRDRPGLEARLRSAVKNVRIGRHQIWLAMNEVKETWHTELVKMLNELRV